ncbi:COP9 signalosome complex subunit [Ooceraea biroi]|uniref:COP9 signalosome complex subunit n=1 Tax=Ooceraea biroi TaxID=2015173 RepID=A0A026WGU6_OOCBI|nr:COP9 signalosome complex subunit [Ooceraea biroi]
MKPIYCHRCNAKFLWKRIPSDIKAVHEELGRIWLVAQRMWQRDWPAVHVALNTEWSDDVKEIMVSLKCKVRERVMKLISKAYSLLNLTSMATISGLSLDEARQAAIDMRWNIIDGTIVQPCKYIDEVHNNVNEFAMTEEKLHKFTEFVSFLEN